MGSSFLLLQVLLSLSFINFNFFLALNFISHTCLISNFNFQFRRFQLSFTSPCITSRFLYHNFINFKCLDHFFSLKLQLYFPCLQISLSSNAFASNIFTFKCFLARRFLISWFQFHTSPSHLNSSSLISSISNFDLNFFNFIFCLKFKCQCHIQTLHSSNFNFSFYYFFNF